jgi:hypothetical protein
MLGLMGVWTSGWVNTLLTLSVLENLAALLSLIHLQVFKQGSLLHTVSQTLTTEHSIFTE